MSSPRIHFFLGAEFSNQVTAGDLNLDKLNKCFSLFKDTEKEVKTMPQLNAAIQYFSDLIFYTEKSNLKKAAIEFGPHDIIIAASAGGHTAKLLIDELAKKQIQPIIIALEAFGLEVKSDVVYFWQQGNPRRISERENQITYEYEDGTMLGHAAYAIRPKEIGKMIFKKKRYYSF